MVFFPGDFDMSGHLTWVRKVRENMLVFNYGHWRQHKSSISVLGYFGTGAVAIKSKYVLHKMAEMSPLFAPIWEDMKGISSSQCGIYLANAPDADWLASIRPEEHRLFAAFRNASDLDKIGLEPDGASLEARKSMIPAFFLAAMQQYSKAGEIFEDLLRDEPTYWIVWVRYVQCLLEQGFPDRAYDVLLRAMERYPDCLMFDKMAAGCCFEMRNWNRAAWHLSRFGDANPWDRDWMWGNAVIALRRDDFELAAILYEECMEHAKLSAESMSHYAVALSKTGRCAEALKIFKTQESEYNAGSPTALSNIGMVLAGLGRPREALDYSRQALEIDQSDEYIWDTAGFVHLKLGQYEEAVSAFLKAIEIAPEFPDAWRHLLHAYYNSGKQAYLEDAEKYVGRILPEQLVRFEGEKGTQITD